MPVSPIRFSAIWNLDRPTPQNLIDINQALQQKGQDVYMVAEKNGDTYGKVIVLTRADAELAKQALLGYQVFAKELAAQDHGAQKSLDLRFLRQVVKATGARNAQALKDWYLQSNVSQIESAHGQVIQWSLRHYDRYKKALGNRLAKLQAELTKAHQEGRLMATPSSIQ